MLPRTSSGCVAGAGERSRRTRAHRARPGERVGDRLVAHPFDGVVAELGGGGAGEEIGAGEGGGAGEHAHVGGAVAIFGEGLVGDGVVGVGGGGGGAGGGVGGGGGGPGGAGGAGGGGG